MLAIIRTCATLGRHREVHMLNLSLINDAWLSKLRKHLDTERYAVGSVNQFMGVARRFLADLDEQHLSITAVPVSYTHLDVYKRQTLALLRLSMFKHDDVWEPCFY